MKSLKSLVLALSGLLLMAPLSHAQGPGKSATPSRGPAATPAVKGNAATAPQKGAPAAKETPSTTKKAAGEDEKVEAQPIPQTAQDHAQLAKKYRQKAEQYRKEAATHRQMAKDYKEHAVPSPRGGPNPWVRKIERHCQTIAKEADRMATLNDKAADMHEARSKEFEQ